MHWFPDHFFPTEPMPGIKQQPVCYFRQHDHLNHHPEGVVDENALICYIPNPRLEYIPNPPKEEKTGPIYYIQGHGYVSPNSGSVIGVKRPYEDQNAEAPEKKRRKYEAAIEEPIEGQTGEDFFLFSAVRDFLSSQILSYMSVEEVYDLASTSSKMLSSVAELYGLTAYLNMKVVSRQFYDPLYQTTIPVIVTSARHLNPKDGRVIFENLPTCIQENLVSTLVICDERMTDFPLFSFMHALKELDFQALKEIVVDYSAEEMIVDSYFLKDIPSDLFSKLTLKNLRYFRFESGGMPLEPWMEKLQSVKGLHALCIKGEELTNELMGYIPTESLKFLGIEGKGNVTSSGMQRLGICPKLKELRVHGIPLAEEWVNNLPDDTLEEVAIDFGSAQKSDPNVLLQLKSKTKGELLFPKGSLDTYYYRNIDGTSKMMGNIHLL